MSVWFYNLSFNILTFSSVNRAKYSFPIEYIQNHRSNVILLCDGLDETGSLKIEIELHLANSREEWKRVILSSRETGFTGECFDKFELVQIQPLTFDQKKQMITRGIKVQSRQDFLIYVIFLFIGQSTSEQILRDVRTTRI